MSLTFKHCRHDRGKARISAVLSFSTGQAYSPVPFRLEVCGLLLALSLTLSCPVLFPVAVGVNVTLVVHLLLAAKPVVHVVADTAKSPLVVITMPVRAALWLLVRVKVFAALVVPTVCDA